MPKSCGLLARWAPLIIGFSAANLYFLDVWKRLNAPFDAALLIHPYHPKYPSFYLALVVLVFGLGACLALILWLCKKIGPRTKQVAILILSIPVLNQLRLLIDDKRLSLGYFRELFQIHLPVAVILSVAGVIFLIALFRYQKQFSTVLRSLFLILTPYLLINTAMATYYYFYFLNSREGVDYSISKNITPEIPIKNRVLLLLFDGLDYDLAFANPPASLSFPAFKAFEQQSMSLTQAHSPADVTLMSIGSYVTGKLPDNMSFLEDFRGQSLFSELKGEAKRSSITGFYFPYCRLFGALSDHCESHCTMGFCMLPYHASFEKNVTELFRWAFTSSRNAKTHTQKYKAIQNSVEESALKLSTQTQYDFVFVHSLMPHYPWINDSHVMDDSLSQTLQGYYGNVVLADQMLARITERLKEQGLWDKTHIIITTDHPFDYHERTADFREWRIPFMVKFAGAHPKGQYSKSINTIFMSGLINQMVTGKVTNPLELNRFLDEHRVDVPMRRTFAHRADQPLIH